MRNAKWKSPRVGALLAAAVGMLGVLLWFVFGEKEMRPAEGERAATAESSPALQRAKASATPGSPDGLKPPTALPAAPAALQTIDLLALVDVQRDLLKAEGFAGANQWTKSGGLLAYAYSDRRPGKISAPVALNDLRDYEIELGQPQEQAASAAFDIPTTATNQGTIRFVPGQGVDLFWDENRKMQKLALWPKDAAAPPWKLAVRIKLGAGGGDGMLTATINGHPAGEWRGNLSRLGISPPEAHPDFPGQLVPNLFALNGKVAYSSWTLRVFDGEAKVLRDTTPATATKDAPFVNSLGMKFVPVPGTNVLFSIWQTRVQDFTGFARRNGVGDWWQNQKLYNVPVSRAAMEPVCGVLWGEARDFCQWLTETEIAAGRLPKGASYRLPTDEEWSRAVGLPPESGTTPAEKSGKNDVDFPWGRSFPPKEKAGNYADAAFHERFAPEKLPADAYVPWIEGYSDGYPLTSPVGSFAANPFGIHDLGSNVLEWCDDWFDGKHETRAARGASWTSTLRAHMLSSNRAPLAPATRYSNAFCGFRCVLDPAPSTASPATTTPQSSSVATATKDAPFVNTLGMKFVPVPITGGPTGGQRVLFSIWETRIRDYSQFADETKRVWPRPNRSDEGPDHPAADLNREDGIAFCAWLTVRERQAGKIRADENYRLPYGEEWTSAVEAGSPSPAKYPWGDAWPPPSGAGNFADESARRAGMLTAEKIIAGYDDGFPQTSPVGSFAPNAFGIFDLEGNLRESTIEQKRPDENCIRGGAWNQTGTGLWKLRGDFADRNQRENNLGFRVVLAPVAPQPVNPSASVTPATATKDAPFVNTLGMKFVPVPGTKVLFCRWETRVKDYAEYVRGNKVDGAWAGLVREGVPVGREPDHPVCAVNWEDAHAFCQWLTEKESAEGILPKGAKYRLPTDEEWSRAVGLAFEQGMTPAAKSGKNAVNFPWGVDFPPKGKAGNYADELFHAKFPSKKAGADDDPDTAPDAKAKTWIEGYTDGFATTAPAGSFPGNDYGIYDLGGNVWEWCEDWFDAAQKDRVLRGASWGNYDRSSLLSSNRFPYAPTLRFSYFGFRCVLEPAPSTALPATTAPQSSSLPTATKAAPATEKWIDLRQGGNFKGNHMVKPDGEGWMVTAQGSTVFAGGPRRDGAVRLRAPFDAKENIRVAVRLDESSKNYYLASILLTGDEVGLNCHRDGKVIKALNERAQVKRKLPKPVQSGEEYELEVRVVGDRFTVRLQGELLLEARDTEYASGAFGIMFGGTGLERKITSLEYLDLGGTAPAATAPGSPSAAPASR